MRANFFLALPETRRTPTPAGTELTIHTAHQPVRTSGQKEILGTPAAFLLTKPGGGSIPGETGTAHQSSNRDLKGYRSGNSPFPFNGYPPEQDEL